MNTNNSDNNKQPFTFEHWEAHDEYIILHNGPIGYTVSKKDAEIITRWLNCAYTELSERIVKSKLEKEFSEKAAIAQEILHGEDLSYFSHCQNCDDLAWDGRICHSCGAKHI